jgi:hypothetical protein
MDDIAAVDGVVVRALRIGLDGDALRCDAAAESPQHVVRLARATDQEPEVRMQARQATGFDEPHLPATQDKKSDDLTRIAKRRPLEAPLEGAT